MGARGRQQHRRVLPARAAGQYLQVPSPSMGRDIRFSSRAVGTTHRFICSTLRAQTDYNGWDKSAPGVRVGTASPGLSDSHTDSATAF